VEVLSNMMQPYGSPLWVEYSRQKFKEYPVSGQYSRIYIDHDKQTTSLETVNAPRLPKNEKEAWEYVVPIQFQNRLDLISQVFYGTPDLDWWIAMYNKLPDSYHVPVGTILIIQPQYLLYVDGGHLQPRRF